MVNDCCALVGLALVGFGCFLIWPPAALIVIGLALVGVGLWRHFHDPK